MLNIINDLVNISIIEAGQMKLSVSIVVINELTEELFAFFKPEAERKGLKLLCFNSLFVYVCKIWAQKELSSYNSLFWGMLKCLRRDAF